MTLEYAQRMTLAFWQYEQYWLRRWWGGDKKAKAIYFKVEETTKKWASISYALKHKN